MHVLNGDTFVQFDAAGLERIWRERHTPVIVAREVDDTSRFGRLDVVDGRVTRFCEKGIAGPGLNFEEEDLTRDLLLSYCRYAYNNAIEYFEENFHREILRLSLMEGVKANA